MKTAVQFGAGNIGRGFVAQLLHEAGYEVIFVDVSPVIIDALNERRKYTIEIVGEDAGKIDINNVRAISSTDTNAVTDAIAGCEIVCSAVGANVLKFIAPNLASGLLKRSELSGIPLNILICENLHDASSKLRALVGECLPMKSQFAILQNTGFVQAVVSRMVPLQTADDHGGDPLAISVERYKRLPVDGSSIVGEFPQIDNVEPISNFAAEVDRKLYTHNCAHATLGYLGWQKHIVFGYEALGDPEIRSVLDQVLNDTGAALINEYGFSSEEQRSYEADLLKRFENRALGDTCFRLARDPVRKLAADDRLVGAARLCERHGIGTTALSEVIAAALQFSNNDDPSSVKLQELIHQIGIERSLHELSGISTSETLGIQVLDAYERANSL